jgi:hypothetical protein
MIGARSFYGLLYLGTLIRYSFRHGNDFTRGIARFYALNLLEGKMALRIAGAISIDNLYLYADDQQSAHFIRCTPQRMSSDTEFQFCNA